MDWKLEFTGHVAPDSLSQAVRELSHLVAQGQSIQIWAGGTDLMPRMRLDWLQNPHAETRDILFRLGAIAELSGIEISDDMLRVGALVSIEEIRRSSLISIHAPALVAACDCFASSQIRHFATLGGNLVNSSPAGDTFGPLLVHRAVAVCARWDGDGIALRRIPIEEFWLAPGNSALVDDELLVCIEMPLFPANGWVAFEKHCRRQAKDIATVSVTLSIEPDGEGGIFGANLALGSVAPTAILVPEVSQLLLNGGFGTAEGHAKAAKIAAQVCSPIDDVRASAEHRRHLVEVLTHRALDAIAANIGAPGFAGLGATDQMTVRQGGKIDGEDAFPPLPPSTASEFHNGSQEVNFTLNGEPFRRDIIPGTSLVSLLREQEQMTGTKLACEEGECGACSVLVDGRAIQSCLTLAVDCAGRNVVTIEGLLGPQGELHDLMEDMLSEGGVQCGFCSPGMVITALSHFRNGGGSDTESLGKALEGNICRCTGYLRLMAGLARYAERLQEGGIND